MAVGQTALGLAVSAMVSYSALSRLSYFKFYIGFVRSNMDPVINEFETAASHVSKKLFL